MSGTELSVSWRGRTVAAWVPDLLSERDLALAEATVRRTEQAAAAATRGSEALPADWEALARLLLRAEGVASSFIEGVRAPLAEVAAAELDPAIGETAAWVADNLAAAIAALGDAHRGPLEVGSLHRWHRRLMAGASHLPAELIGAARNMQGWIGGTSPLDAALVVSPPEHIAPLLDDLVAFANRTDVDPVTQAAVAHAQFEIVHPYADGNGRVGRILAGWILTRRLRLASPPPISVRIATDRGGYLSGLTLFRLGHVDPWVAWFAEVISGAGDAATSLVRDVGELQARWEERVAHVRADASAHRVLALLPAHPVLTASTLAGELGMSDRAARDALATLAAHGIVERFRPARISGGDGGRSPGRPQRWWAATELLSLLSAWSR